jgi:hypothetical protein
MRDQYEGELKLLLIAAGCVLLVTCGNLAYLMLALFRPWEVVSAK